MISWNSTSSWSPQAAPLSKLRLAHLQTGILNLPTHG